MGHEHPCYQWLTETAITRVGLARRLHYMDAQAGNTKYLEEKKIMNPTAKKAKLGAKKLEKKVPLTQPLPKLR
jgi:hypothetical protein